MLFFFFQEEDGIRDRDVTGVQTCALPIWRHPQCSEFGFGGRQVKTGQTPQSLAWRLQEPERITRGFLRSEERRVGKECRSRVSPVHSKKKTRTTRADARMCRRQK